MTILEKLKAKKQKIHEFNKEQENAVNIILNNYEDIEQALNEGYTFSEIMNVIDGLEVSTPQASLMYMTIKLSRESKKFTKTAENKEVKESKKEEKLSKSRVCKDSYKGLEAGNSIAGAGCATSEPENMKGIKFKPSNLSIASHIRDRNILGYAVIFCDKYNRNDLYTTWVVSHDRRHALMSALTYLKAQNKKQGRNIKSYKQVSITEMTYIEYIDKYKDWETE